MAEGAPVRRLREWFVDERTPVRRMQATWHPETGLVVFSFWQGDACTGTFRLPVADGDRLVGLLGDALGDAARARAEAERTVAEREAAMIRPARRSLGTRLAGLFKPRPTAEVLPFKRP